MLTWRGHESSFFVLRRHLLGGCKVNERHVLAWWCWVFFVMNKKEFLSFSCIVSQIRRWSKCWNYESLCLPGIIYRNAHSGKLKGREVYQWMSNSHTSSLQKCGLIPCLQATLPLYTRIESNYSFFYRDSNYRTPRESSCSLYSVKSLWRRIFVPAAENDKV